MGFIDQRGQVVIKPMLEHYRSNHGDQFIEGLLLTGVSEGAYVDRTGRVVLDTKYERNWDFSEGLAVAMKENHGKWGYIDKTGKFIISPRFETYPNGYVYSFSNGLAMIEVKDRYGYIDRTGKFVIEPRFLAGNGFSEGFARVVVEGPCVFVGDGPCADFNARGIGDKEESQKTSEMCKFTFVDKQGRIITSRRFERAMDFSEGLAAVQVDGKWGFINKQGQIIISPQFDGAKSFSDGLALIKQNELWGYINKSGNIVIPPQFARAEDFSDGLAPVGKWNEQTSEYENYFYINKDGKQAFKGIFAEASHFFKGLAHVKLMGEKSADRFYLNGKFAYINTTGKVVFRYEVSGQDD